MKQEPNIRNNQRQKSSPHQKQQQQQKTKCNQGWEVQGRQINSEGLWGIHKIAISEKKRAGSNDIIASH